MGRLDALSGEFVRAYSERLCKHLVVAPETAGEPSGAARAEMPVVLSLAVAAAGAVIIGSWLVEAKQNVMRC
jgi:hypothetical protein